MDQIMSKKGSKADEKNKKRISNIYDSVINCFLNCSSLKELFYIINWFENYPENTLSGIESISVNCDARDKIANVFDLENEELSSTIFCILQKYYIKMLLILRFKDIDNEKVTENSICRLYGSIREKAKRDLVKRTIKEMKIDIYKTDKKPINRLVYCKTKKIICDCKSKLTPYIVQVRVIRRGTYETYCLTIITYKCEKCDLHYFDSWDYLKDKENLLIMAGILKESDLVLVNGRVVPGGKYKNYVEHHPIWLYGYNVSDKKSARDRFEVLKAIYDYDLVPGPEIEKHIENLIEERGRRFPDAESKWTADLDKIKMYIHKKKNKVDKLHISV